jgi:hypothetical protein
MRQYSVRDATSLAAHPSDADLEHVAQHFWRSHFSPVTAPTDEPPLAVGAHPGQLRRILNLYPIRLAIEL